MTPQPIIFSHIPKTAGTSFRAALEKTFTTQKGLLDYGAVGSTSPIIRELSVDQDDRFALHEYIQANDIRFISGHMGARRYVTLFGASSMTTIFRDPIERAYSEYVHALMHTDFTGGVRKFVQKPGRNNMQANASADVPIPAFGQIGLTETYSESLADINHYFGLSLPELVLNKKESNAPSLADEPQGVINKLREVNARDLELYQDALDWLEIERQYGKRTDPSFVSGEVSQANRRAFHGWASVAATDEPVVVELLRNGKPIQEARATLYRPRLREFKMNRDGHLGFEFRIHKYFDKARYEVVVKETKQPLLRGCLQEGVRSTSVG